MIGITADKQLETILRNENLIISDDFRLDKCKFRQCERTCRYIMLGPKGFVCTKHTSIKEAIDALCTKHQMTAQGDNCDGLGAIRDGEAQISNETETQG